MENEGLIDYIPNRGCFAKGFTKQDVEDIYAVREALEEMAVRWAVARISENEIDEMEEQCDLMEFYTRKKDKKKVMEYLFPRSHLRIGKKPLFGAGAAFLQGLYRQNAQIGFL